MLLRLQCSYRVVVVVRLQRLRIVRRWHDFNGRLSELPISPKVGTMQATDVASMWPSTQRPFMSRNRSLRCRRRCIRYFLETLQYSDTNSVHKTGSSSHPVFPSGRMDRERQNPTLLHGSETAERNWKKNRPNIHPSKTTHSSRHPRPQPPPNGQYSPSSWLTHPSRVAIMRRRSDEGEVAYSPSCVV